MTIKYTLEDNFPGDYVAGAVNGTVASPGPGGLRKTVENDGTISVSSGVMNISGQATIVYGDLGFYYSLPFGRTEDMTVEFRLRRTGNGVCAGIGLCNDISLSLASRIHCFQINDSSVDLRTDPTAGGVAVFPNLTWADFKIVLHDVGCDYYYNDVLVDGNRDEVIVHGDLA